MVARVFFLTALLAGHANASRVQVAQKMAVEGQYDGLAQVEVLYVRHGHGCHDAMVEQGSSGQQSYADPPLTNCGLANSKSSGEKLQLLLTAKQWNAHFIASSTNLRTMETAMAMFPEEIVHPVPFMAEKPKIGNLWGNVDTLLPVDTQKEILKSWNYTLFPSGGVDFKYLPTGTVSLVDDRIGCFTCATPGKYSAADARTASAHKAWRAWVGEMLLPDLMHLREGPNVPLRLVMVSDNDFIGNTMTKYFNCEEWPGGHNAAVFAKFNYFTDSKKLVEVEDYCDVASDATETNWDASYLCPKDYERCFDHGGETWMGRDPHRPGYSKYIETLPDNTEHEQGCCIDM